MNGASTRALQRAARAGLLSTSELAALKATDPHWADEPAERRWWATLDAYSQWVVRHEGRHPTAGEVSAPGLHAWASRQNDQNLNLSQRSALRRIPGWTRTAGDPAWDAARRAIRVLLAAGVTLADGGVRAELLANKDDTEIPALPTIDTSRRLLLTVLSFAVQTGRLPEHLEPGSRWQKHVTSEVTELLPQHVFEQPRLTVRTHLERRSTLHRLRDAGLAHDAGALEAEDTWFRRHARLAQRGLLSAADTAALLES
jgi:hypothetical protein